MIIKTINKITRVRMGRREENLGSNLKELTLEDGTYIFNNSRNIFKGNNKEVRKFLVTPEISMLWRTGGKADDEEEVTRERNLQMAK